MSNLLESVVIVNHQVFSKSNLGVEIVYLDKGWAIKAPKEVSFVKKENKMFALINNISYFIQSRFQPDLSDIHSTQDEEGSFLYYVLKG